MLYEVGYPNRPYGQYNTSRPKEAVKMYCDQYGIKAKDINRLGTGVKTADMHILLEVKTYGYKITTATYAVVLGE